MEDQINQLAKLLMESIGLLKDKSIPRKRQELSIKHIHEILSFNFTLPPKIFFSLISAILSSLEKYSKQPAFDEFVIESLLELLERTCSTYKHTLLKMFEPESFGQDEKISIMALINSLKDSILMKSDKIQNCALEVLLIFIKKLPRTNLGFCMPGICISLVKLIIGKYKATNKFISRCIFVFEKIVLKQLSEENQDIKTLFPNLFNGDLRNKILSQISQVVNKKEERKDLKNEKEANTIPKNEVKEKGSFEIIINKEWYSKTWQKIVDSLIIIDDALSNHRIEISNFQINQNLLNLISSLFSQCSHSISQSSSLFITIFIKIYFFQDESKISKQHFSKFIKNPTLMFNIKTTLQELFSGSISSLKKINLEVDSMKKRMILKKIIGLSWLFETNNLMCSDSAISDLSIVLLNLITFEQQSAMISEVEEKFQKSKNIVQDQGNFHRIDPSFIHEQISKFYSTQITTFEGDKRIFHDFCFLISSFPKQIKNELFEKYLSSLENCIQAQNQNQINIIQTNSYLSKLLFLLSHLLESAQLEDKNEQNFPINFLKVLLDLSDFCSLPKSPLHKYTNKIFLGTLSLALSKIFENKEFEFSSLKRNDENNILILILEQLSCEYELIRMTNEHCLYLFCEGLKRMNPNELLKEKYFYILDIIFNKLKYFSFEKKEESTLLIISSLISKTPLLFKDHVANILEFLLHSFDRYFLQNSIWVIENFIPIFIKIIQFIDQAYFSQPTWKSEAATFNGSNLIRGMLLRVKPLLGSKENYLVVKTLELFTWCVNILSNVGLETEDAQNFSQEDAENVTIPNALNSISFEFWPFFLKNIKHTNLSIINFSIKAITQITHYSPSYLESDRRFAAEVFPIIKTYIKKAINQNVLLIKVQVSCFQLINEIPINAYTEIADEVVQILVEYFHPNKPQSQIYIEPYLNRFQVILQNAKQILQKNIFQKKLSPAFTTQYSFDTEEKCIQYFSSEVPKTSARPGDDIPQLFPFCHNFAKELFKQLKPGNS